MGKDVRASKRKASTHTSSGDDNNPAAGRASSSKQEVIWFRMSYGEEVRWLSNLYPAPFTLRGQQYHHVEGFFQSSKYKGSDPAWAAHIQGLHDGKAAKQAGSKTVRPLPVERIHEWDRERDAIMLVGLRAKFEQNPDLRSRLVATGARELRENGRDKYWAGMKNSRNRLGELLSQVRAELSEGLRSTEIKRRE
ncbi:unnamed protein product [Calypogeia fissa]